ncbi:MAG: hypothetical protein E7647_03535 [Ruminococcaceae bacterium]|nr:hypothetical protein [Oscillospiraceae bacterium]
MVKKSKKFRKKMPPIVFIAAILGILLTAIIAVIVIGNIPPEDEENPFSRSIEQKIESERAVGVNTDYSYQYQNAVLDAIEYDILKYDEDKLCATVRFTYVDVLKLAEGYEEDIDDVNDFYRYCIESIESDDAPSITKKINVDFYEINGDEGRVLMVEDSVEMADVLTGGFASVYNEIIEG